MISVLAGVVFVLVFSFVLALCKCAGKQIPTDGETREMEHHLMRSALKRGFK